MSTQIEIAGKLIDLNENIKYNFQVNDIAEVRDRQANYTSTFKLPKIKEVVEIFEGLSISGDTSSSPYKKITVRLFDNYVPVMESGWLVIKKSDDRYYHVATFSGVVDFFKAIENKNIQTDLDLTELNHEKTVQTIIDSWSNDLAYRYLISDYNGRTNYTITGLTGTINSNYQVPSVRLSYLWDKIFETFGFTYSGYVFGTTDFLNKYITFPKPPQSGEEDITDLVIVKNNGFSANPGPWPTSEPPYQNEPKGYEFWDEYDPPVINSDYIELNPDNWTFNIKKDGNFSFNLASVGEATYCERLEYNSQFNQWRCFGSDNDVFIVEILVNGVVKRNRYSDPTSQDYHDIGYPIALFEGDTVEIKVVRDYYRRSNGEKIYSIDIDKIEFKISIIENQSVLGTDIINMSVKDFFKEVLWRFSLTPFVDKYSNNIEFLTLSERLNSHKIINWSDKYIRRKDETYVYGYSQQNAFTLKYNEEGGDSYNDGYLFVGNENISDFKPIINSKFYSPDEFIRQIGINESDRIEVPTFRMWNKEIQETEGGGIETNYKQLDGRIYLLSQELVNQNIDIGNERIQGTIQTAEAFYKAKNSINSWQYWIDNYYQDFENVLQDTRIHIIELTLTPVDVYDLNFQALYFFEQEANYYMLNKLTFEPGKKSQAEFVRVKFNKQLGEFSDDFSNSFNI